MIRPLLRVFYSAAAKLASVAPAFVPPRDDKVALALRARRGIRSRYARWATTQRDRARRLVWMHASSVGEGLMARPILSLLRQRHPELQLAYTFFSPSAEEFSRGLDADFRDYLPFDAIGDMQAALDALAPSVIVFSKVDVWPELVRQAKRRGVKLAMTSAALAPGSARRSRIAGMLLHDAYAALDAVGAVDDDTRVRLVELGVRPDVIEVTGDTRFDQVWERAQRLDRSVGLIAQLASDRPTVVAGSTWPSDEAPLLEAFARLRERVPTARLIIAPHELTRDHMEPIAHWARDAGLSFAPLDHADDTADVVLVDTYGVLGDLYALASVAFVGGGFHDKGLHSVLEPASHGAPVLFGPRHTNSRDAILLLASGGAKAVATSAEIEDAIGAWCSDSAARRRAGAAARQVIENGRGAAERSTRIVELLMGLSSSAAFRADQQ